MQIKPLRAAGASRGERRGRRIKALACGGMAWTLAGSSLPAAAAEAEKPTPPSPRVIFQEDFTRSANLEDYFSSQGGDNEFDDISAAPDGGTWRISDGKLQIERPAQAGPAGIARTTPLGDQPTAIELRFEFSLEGNADEWGGFPFDLDIGEWKKGIGHGTPGSYDFLFTRLSVQLSSRPGEFRIRLAEAMTPNFHADGTPYSVVVVANGSGGDLAYAGPDGRSHTIGDQNVSVWINDSLVLENVHRGRFRCPHLSSFRVRMATSSAVTVQFDEFSVADLSPR